MGQDASRPRPQPHRGHPRPVQPPAPEGTPASGPGSQAPAELAEPHRTRENRKILLVGREAHFTAAAVDYALNLADRLGYDLIVLNVGPEGNPGALMQSPYRRWLQEKFKRQALTGAALIARKAQAKGLRLEHLVRFGDLGQAVERLNQEKRRIEFVINASEVNEPEMAGGVNLPVFTIKGDQGEKIMAQLTGKKGLAIKTLAYGAASAVLYAAVFLNRDTVMNYFTRGSWFAALPIATVFVFSFFHGTFAHNLWETLGIQAPKKVVQPQPAARRPVRRQRPRPRLRLNV